VEAASEADWKESLTSYVLEHGNSLDFTAHFWRGCEPLPQDVNQYRNFVKALLLIQRGLKASNVAAELGINANSIFNWRHLYQMPKLGHFLKAFLDLGPPSNGRLWLTLEQSHGHAIPLGQFIQVPITIQTWAEVKEVLSQIKPKGEESSKFTRPYLFGFLLGIVIGDGHKPKQGRGHRRLNLVMSKKYETNLKIGDFTCLCANQLGLRMEKGEDMPKPPDKPHGFFQWNSQSSPLMDWIFLVAIGLADGQHTTYDIVHLDWALEAPRDFRVGLVQGIAESDGSVSIASQTVEFWVIPDWEFMIKLLATFGLRGFRNREAVSLVKTQAIKSFEVPVFSDYLQTVRYEKLKLMAMTRKLERTERIPEEIRVDIGRLALEGKSVPQIVEAIARTRNLLISFEAAQRWVRNSNNTTGLEGKRSYPSHEAKE
jgi:transposase-like protein